MDFCLKVHPEETAEVGVVAIEWLLRRGCYGVVAMEWLLWSSCYGVVVME